MTTQPSWVESDPLFPVWPSDLVRSNYIYLLQQCKPRALLDCLVERNLLIDEELEIIQKQLADANTSNRDVNRNLLLSVLPRKGPGAFDSFAYCLFFAQGNVQRHILMDLDFHFDKRGAVKQEFEKLMTKLYGMVTETLSQEESCGRTIPVPCSEDPHHTDHHIHVAIK